MKKFLLLLTLFVAFGFSDLLAAPPSYIQTGAFTPAKEKAAAERTLTVYTKEILTLKLNKASAFMRLTTGAVAFRNCSGNKILNEKPTGGRSFQSATFNHTRYHYLPPTIQTTLSQTGNKKKLAMNCANEKKLLHIACQYLPCASLLMQPVCESMKGLMTCKLKTKQFTSDKINLFSLNQNAYLYLRMTSVS